MIHQKIFAVLTLAASTGGCSGFHALDQAASDLASQQPTCVQDPAIGIDSYGGRTCRISHTVWSSTTTTVEEPGEKPVTTRTITTPSGTTTEVVPTP
ncbi:MAG: hypothetical protein ACK4OJ_02180 [Brevundimonas sp.]|jgi:hypothetical protein